MDIRQYITMTFGQRVAIVLLHGVFSCNCFGVGMVHGLDICFPAFILSYDDQYLLWFARLRSSRGWITAVVCDAA
jgi:hypothetical protein